MNRESIKRAIEYWNVAIQYLHLAQHVSDAIVTQGNLWIVAGEPQDPDTEYFEKTKWSDHNLGMPLLFSFYHGLEVTMKGFIVAAGEEPETKHKLTDLFGRASVGIEACGLRPVLAKYLDSAEVPSPLREFFDSSKINVDQYYQALRYPESVKRDAYKHGPLYYNGEWGVEFFAGVRDDVVEIRKAVVRYGRDALESA